MCRVPEPMDPQGQWQDLMERFPRDAAALTLVERSGRHLADALRGRYDPLQLLFPGGSFDVADKLYQESPGAVAHNSLAQEVISAIVEQLPGKADHSGVGGWSGKRWNDCICAAQTSRC